jgi:hypothetical protein
MEIIGGPPKCFRSIRLDQQITHKKNTWIREKKVEKKDSTALLSTKQPQKLQFDHGPRATRLLAYTAVTCYPRKTKVIYFILLTIIDWPLWPLVVSLLVSFLSIPNRCPLLLFIQFYSYFYSYLFLQNNSKIGKVLNNYDCLWNVWKTLGTVSVNLRTILSFKPTNESDFSLLFAETGTKNTGDYIKYTQLIEIFNNKKQWDAALNR